MSGPASEADAGETGTGTDEAGTEAAETGADTAEAGTDTAEAGTEAVEDDGPRPLGIGVRPTGHAPLDARLRRLEDADHLAVSGHLEVYEDVHGALRETLAALDRPHPTPRS
ncbi:hypothetical protein ABT395_08950 [Streptomyces cacaoi]